MRFTKTWSPISNVFSIELDGISNACTTKVMMNSPVTNTAASDDRNSTVVSFGFSSTLFFSKTASLFATFVFRQVATWCLRSGRAALARLELAFTQSLNDPMTQSPSVYQPQRPVPARDLKDVRHRICQMLQPALNRSRRIAIPIFHGPINHQRAPDNIFARH